MTTVATRRLPFLAFVGLLTLVAPGALLPAQPKIANPDLYKKSVKAAVQVVEQYGVDFGAEDVGRLQDVGYRLVQAAGFDRYPFSFAIVEMPIPNAFALPAGQIFVTRGMLDLGLTDDMLGSLLGHEIAHVTKEHFLRMKRRATLLNVLSQLAIVGAAVAEHNSRDDYYQGPGGYWQRDSNAGDMLEASYTASAAIGELLMRSYSRDNENEADEEGQRIAAMAGFEPDGMRQLMAKMGQRIPQDKTFGYWQTHPFFDQRVIAAEARAGVLAKQNPATAEVLDNLRQATQALLLEQRADPAIGPVGSRFLEDTALAAWPGGDAADGVRGARLHELRDTEMERLATSRDYGRVISAYRTTIKVVEGSSGVQSAALAAFRQELATLEHEKEELFPHALKIWTEGIYETSFLENFLSNYPGNEHTAEVSLALGIAYSRLSRESDAVGHFLEAWEADPTGELGQKAARGLRNLAPQLDELAALEPLALQDRDDELRDLAIARLEKKAPTYTQLRNGAAYLKGFPEGLFAETAAHRLDDLADIRYREMLLYRELGDAAKAITAANDILRHAPLSPAARRLANELKADDIPG